MKMNIPIITSFKSCGQIYLDLNCLETLFSLIGKYLLGYQRYQVPSERPWLLGLFLI